VRLFGFFLVVFLLLSALRVVPVIGAVFQYPLVGVFLAAAIVSVVAARTGSEVVKSRKQAAELRRLEAVSTPHNRGKLGRLLEMGGRAKEAIEPLEEAIAGEPEVVEWHYRLGRAQFALSNFAAAIKTLQHAAELNEEYAYGDVLLSLAEAQRRGRQSPAALETLERYETLNGPTPESAYRRGQNHSAQKDRDQARAAFDEVASLAASLAAYQRKTGRSWAAKALFARLFS
jgi:tetratricopeptide (TPR) repeat protein